MHDTIYYIEHLVEFINSFNGKPDWSQIEEICVENGWWFEDLNRISTGYDEYDIVINENGVARLELIEGGFGGPIKTSLFDTLEEAEAYGKSIPNYAYLNQSEYLSGMFIMEDEKTKDVPKYISSIDVFNERGTLMAILGFLK